MYPADVPPPPAVVHIDDTARVIRKAPAASRAVRPADPIVPGAGWVAAPQWHVPASEYVGPYYDPRFEAVRECIVRRESENEPWVVNSQGYQGLYQWGQGWTGYLSRITGGVGPIHTWTRYQQTMAFWVVWDHGAGASNWAGGRWAC